MAYVKRKIIKIVSVLIVFLGVVGLLYALLTHAADYSVTSASPKNGPIRGAVTVTVGLPTPTPIASQTLNPTQVRAYVEGVAVADGVNPVDALWILDHESEDCWQEGYYDPALVAHEPNGTESYGCFQFNSANPDFDLSCADDLTCSTNLAMQWILEGKINRWSTWRLRCEWFADAPDCP
jgi:hypothetical protein